MAEFGTQNAAIDAAIFEIAQAFGVRTDKVAPIVDQYGAEYSLAALWRVQHRMSEEGYRPQSPFAVMVSLLRKGEIQVEAEREATPDPVDDFVRQRYHNAQADPHQDTAAKRLARKSGIATVSCSCGAEHPSELAP